MIFLHQAGCFFFVSASSFSQSVNIVPIKDINEEYIQIIGIPGPAFSNKIQVIIDFGQRNKLFTRNSIIRDSAGKKLDFNSMIDGLNFMNDNGYEFVQAYAADITAGNVEHYICCERKSFNVL